MSFLTMIPSAAVLEADLKGLGLDVRSFREPLNRSIRQVMVPSIRENFLVGGRPPWEPLADSTLVQNTAGTPLVRTGTLMRAATQINVWTVTKDEAYVTTLPARAWYGITHQEGIGVPERPFYVFQEEDINHIEDVFDNWLQERLAARGFTTGAIVSTGGATSEEGTA